MEETLGTRIASHRKRLGLTQDQLAEQLGITAQAISKWEHDQSCPDITMLPRLGEIFGITIDSLLGVEREPVHIPEVITEKPAQPSQGIPTARGNFELQWDVGKKGNLSLAALVLLVGGLMLAGNILQWEVSFWGLLWPSALLVYGLANLYPRFGFWQLGSILLGGFALAKELDILPPVFRSGMVFPLLLLLFGLSLLVDALGKPKKSHSHIHQNHQRVESYQTDETTFSCETIFGGNQRYIVLPLLTHGQASCHFGNLELDLSGCAEISDDCTIHLDCSFGEITLSLPRRFRAEISSDAVFSSVSITGDPDSDAAPIEIHCDAAFGSIKICYL